MSVSLKGHVIIDFNDNEHGYDEYGCSDDTSVKVAPIGDNHSLKIINNTTSLDIQAPLDTMLMIMDGIASEFGFKVVPMVCDKTSDVDIEACSEYFDAHGTYHKNKAIAGTPAVISASVDGKDNSLPDIYPKEVTAGSVFLTRTVDLGFSLRLESLLLSYKLHDLLLIVRCTGNELLAYPQFGRASLTELQSVLHKKGFYLGMTYTDIRRRANKEQANKL